MKHVAIEIKFYNLDTFKKQIDVNFIDLDSNLVDLNYKVASLIFCHFWRSITIPEKKWGTTRSLNVDKFEIRQESDFRKLQGNRQNSL